MVLRLTDTGISNGTDECRDEAAPSLLASNEPTSAQTLMKNQSIAKRNWMLRTVGREKELRQRCRPSQ